MTNFVLSGLKSAGSALNCPQLYRMYRKLTKMRSCQQLLKCFTFSEKEWSGRKDLNLRPPGPEPGALARLRYAPTVCAQAAQNSRANQTRIAQLPNHGAVPAIYSLRTLAQLLAGTIHRVQNHLESAVHHLPFVLHSQLFHH